MGKEKVLLIIGGILGMLGVILSEFIPNVFGWYHFLEGTNLGSDTYYVSGLGNVFTQISNYYPKVAVDMSILMVLGGSMVMAGAFTCLGSSAKKLKNAGIVGGIGMLLGLLFFLIDLLAGISEFAQFVNGEVDYFGLGSVFSGHASNGGGYIYYEIWYGFYITLASGFLALIGGILRRRHILKVGLTQL